MLQRKGAAETLQVSDQGQLAAALALPTNRQSAAQRDLHVNRHNVISESLQAAATLRLEPQLLKTGGQAVDITQDRGQDREMGHEPWPALTNPSHPELAVQWPLPPTNGPSRPLRLGVMASGNGSNFEALLTAIGSGRLCAEVAVLLVNNAGCGAEQRARRHGIACQLHDHRCHASRESLDQALVLSLRHHSVELVVMAGWMRIVTPVLIQAFSGRLINIHPSLLPSFRGIDAISQALAAGVTLAGCTVHLVTEEVDAGEILMQAAVPVLADDDHTSLSARIQQQEHRLLPAAVALMAQRLAAQG